MRKKIFLLAFIVFGISFSFMDDAWGIYYLRIQKTDTDIVGDR